MQAKAWEKAYMVDLSPVQVKNGQIATDLDKE